MIKRVFGKFGIDKTIAITILTRIIQAGGGVISIIFIAKFLSAKEQGYYYTFASILAIQVFFELGLSGIITQYAAHEFAHLRWTDNNIEGDVYYKSRLSSLLRFCVKWFAIISILLFFLLLTAGFFFFRKYPQNQAIDWKMPWIILCATTSFNLFIDPILAFFDGLGEIKDMAKVRLIQKSFNILLLFLLFVLGFKLYSAALASLIAILINYYQIFFTGRIKLLKAVWKEKGKDVISYVKEIFPYQWKIALSWISGYFIFQLFNPVLFATEGAKVAGQMGMTLTALNGVSSLSMSWISTKIPLFSGLIAKKEYVQLDNIFNKTVKQLFSINLLLIGLFVVGVFCLQQLHLSLAERFLGITPLILLSLTVICNQFVFSWATYLRCHKEEPFLLLSIVIGILCCLSTLLLGQKYGLIGLVSGYSFLMIIVSLVWGYIIFKRKKMQWH